MDKKGWPSLVPMDGTPERKESEFNENFLEHHHNADQLIFEKSSGKPMIAFYLTPLAVRKKEIKTLMKNIQRDYLFECEIEQEPKGEDGVK